MRSVAILLLFNQKFCTLLYSVANLRWNCKLFLVFCFPKSCFLKNWWKFIDKQKTDNANKITSTHRYRNVTIFYYAFVKKATTATTESQQSHVSKVPTWQEKQFKKYSFLILFTDVTTKNGCEHRETFFSFLCVSWISIEHSLKRDELVKCEQFHKNIFHLYRYIQIHHEMWISFYPPKSPNMWNYKFMCFEPLVKLQIKH